MPSERKERLSAGGGRKWSLITQAAAPKQDPPKKLYPCMTVRDAAAQVNSCLTWRLWRHIEHNTGELSTF